MDVLVRARPPRRVLILYASVGGGHAAAARALRADLAAEAPVVEVALCDVLAHFPWPLRLILCDWYRFLLRFAPWLYGLIYWLKTRVPWARRLDGLALVLLGGGCLRRLVETFAPDTVVSTYPATTAMLGRLRRRGRIEATLCATITDLVGLAYSAHPSVDLHLVVDETCLAQIENVAGAGSAVVVRPPIEAAFFSPPSRQEARRRLGLAAEGEIVVVSGGGWGVGDLEGAAKTALAVPARTIILTGRNERLRRRLQHGFADQPRALVLGFFERMPDLLAAADALIHASGGVTALEAITCGCPLIAYGSPPGHVRENDAALDKLGLAVRAASRRTLSATLDRVLKQPRPAPAALASRPTAAALVLAAQSRFQSPRTLQRAPSGKGKPSTRRALAGALAATTLLALGGWTFFSPAAYPLVGFVAHLRGLRSVITRMPAVALVIEAPDSVAVELAERLARSGNRASFAFAHRPSARTLAQLARDGDEPIPALGTVPVPGVFGLSHSLSRLARMLGCAHRFDYLVPSSGLTLADYLAAGDAGGKPVVGAIRMRSGKHARLRALHAGSIIVLRAKGDAASAVSALGRLLVQVHRQALHSVPLSRPAPPRDHRPFACAAAPPRPGGRRASPPRPRARAGRRPFRDVLAPTNRTSAAHDRA